MDGVGWWRQMVARNQNGNSLSTGGGGASPFSDWGELEQRSETPDSLVLPEVPDTGSRAHGWPLKRPLVVASAGPTEAVIWGSLDFLEEKSSGWSSSSSISSRNRSSSILYSECSLSAVGIRETLVVSRGRLCVGTSQCRYLWWRGGGGGDGGPPPWNPFAAAGGDAAGGGDAAAAGGDAAAAAAAGAAVVVGCLRKCWNGPDGVDPRHDPRPWSTSCTQIHTNTHTLTHARTHVSTYVHTHTHTPTHWENGGGGREREREWEREREGGISPNQMVVMVELVQSRLASCRWLGWLGETDAEDAKGCLLEVIPGRREVEWRVTS